MSPGMMQERLMASSLTMYGSFEKIRLGDSRLNQRLQQSLAAISKTPEKSFPEIFPNKADLTGFYRLVNNDKVPHLLLLEAACSETRNSIRDKSNLIGQETLALHDTSSFDFTHTSNIKGLGRLTTGRTGFFGHFCIATDLTREIHGLLGSSLWTRTGEPVKKEEKAKKIRADRLANIPTESDRWLNLILEVQEQFDSGDIGDVIHVADREADDYTSFATMQDQQIRFVFRVRSDRKIKDGNQEYYKLFDSLREVQTLCERDVQLPERQLRSRRPQDVRNHPARKSRQAQLGISAKQVEICRPTIMGAEYPKTLSLNFVRVFEINTPMSETPIEWLLVTSEVIETQADLLKIIDIYRTRWVIEEYFKALKTGCSFEKRGLESLDALYTCLAIFAPLACKIYNLKMLGRNHPDSSSQPLVTETQVKLLALKTKKPEKEMRTMGGFMYAVAQIGGHLKYNGPPGWQVLFRGYEKLLQLEEGYNLAKNLNASQYV